jgi:hypothetical protein
VGHVSRSVNRAFVLSILCARRSVGEMRAGTLVSVPSFANRIRSATAFWKPAITGAGMYLMSVPTPRAPNSAWNTPASRMTRKRTVSVCPTLHPPLFAPAGTMVCSTTVTSKSARMLRGA